MLYPIQEVPKKRIQQIKDAVKRKLLEKATNGWKKPVTDFVIRETVMGDTSCTDVYDIQPKTAISSGIPLWGFDAADLTAKQLSQVTASGAEVDDNRWVAFFGFADISGEAGALTGAADTPPAQGQITAIQFQRGSSVLDIWSTEHLYAYDEVVGITDTPIIFEESEAYEILVNATEATEDKLAVIRGYTCEPIGEGHFNPTASRNIDARAEAGVDAVSLLPQERQIEIVMRGGMDPVQELTEEQISRLYTRAKLGLYKMIVEAGDAKSVSDAKEKYFIRPLCAGDKDGLPDTYVDVNEDAQDSGYSKEEHWFQDSAVFTATGDLVNVIKTGETIADKTYVAIFGLSDRTSNSALLEVAPADAGGNLDFADVQHLYAYHDMVKGYTQRITYYKPNASFAYKMSVSSARDHHVMPLGLLAEPYGHVVSKK